MTGRENGPDRRNGDDDQNDERDHGPRDLERGVAVNVFWLGLAWPLAEFDQRPDEDSLDKNEDAGPEPNQEPEEIVDVPIDIRALMKNRLGVVLTTGSEQRGQGDRQRDRTRFAGARPAQAGEKRHAVSLYRAF